MNNIQIIQGDFEKKLVLPIAEGLKAGFPSPAEDYSHETLDFNRDLIRNPEATFYGKVEGDSMIEAGINDGDIAVIDRSVEPQDGDVVVGYINDEFTIIPYCNAMPPHHSQFLLHPLVPFLVAYYLCIPVLGSRLGHHKQPAPLVPMPEAPVHKDACPVFPQHYVRFPRQSRMVKPISKATSPQEFPHQHFRLRVLALYRSHAPWFRSQFVHKWGVVVFLI